LPLKTLAPNGFPACIALAIIESAGIMYANVGPVIVSGLARTAVFDAERAGYVLSSNLFGTALGGLLVIPLLARLNWRGAAAVLLGMLMAMDLASAYATQAEHFYALRFIHGLCGGALIGFSLSVIARTRNPERTISLFITLQLVSGGVLAAVATPLLDTVGLKLIWFVLVAYAIVGLALLPLLGPYPVQEAGRSRGRTPARAGAGSVMLVMAAVLVFQVGEMGAFAYVVEQGLGHGFSAGFIGTALATSLWLGGPAALFVAWWGIRSGRLRPLLVSVLACGLAILALTVPVPWAFFAANVLFAMAFGISISYMLGVGSELDNSGRMGAVAGFFSSFGLSVGPAIAGFLVGNGMLNGVFVLGSILIIASAAMLWGPARMLDRKSRTVRVRWE
jgi:MFS family permease